VFLSQDASSGAGENAVKLQSMETTDLQEQISCLFKQKQFRHLPKDAIVIVPRGQSQQPNENEEEVSQGDEKEEIVSINTIVLQSISGETGSKETFLVILSEDDKIDMTKLERLWKETNKQQFADSSSSLERIELAPSDHLQQLVGYPAGCIPPLGHKISSSTTSSTVLPTIIDEKLVQNTARRKLLGGGGSMDFKSLVKLSALIGLDHIEVGDVRVTKDEDGMGDSTDLESAVPNLPPRTISLPPWGSEARPKPFFPINPPDMEQAKALLSETSPEEDLPASEAPWVTMVGVIGGVRRMSKRLLFCDFLPVGFEDENGSRSSEVNGGGETTAGKEWKCAADEKDISVQLIAGNTLLQAMGEVQGQNALKRLQPGQQVLIQAKLNVLNSRSSLEQWVESRSLDLTMVSYQILFDSPPRPRGFAPPENLPPVSNEKAKKPYLEFKDIFPADVIENGDSGQSDSLVTLVDDEESLESFSSDLTHLLDSRPDRVNGGVAASVDDVLDPIFVGIDCEWLPNFYAHTAQESQPVLILQICIQNQLYVLDLQALSRPLLGVHEKMTSVEEQLNESIEKLFLEDRLFMKVGFSLRNDLERLALSYPHISAFQEIRGVVEAGQLATKAMRFKKQKNARMVTSSLNRLSEFFLDRSVNKEQQVSNWSQRPLTDEQLQYAALDAAITPALVKKVFKSLQLQVFAAGPYLGRFHDDASFR